MLSACVQNLSEEVETEAFYDFFSKFGEILQCKTDTDSYGQVRRSTARHSTAQDTTAPDITSFWQYPKTLHSVRAATNGNCASVVAICRNTFYLVRLQVTTFFGISGIEVSSMQDSSSQAADVCRVLTAW